MLKALLRYQDCFSGNACVETLFIAELTGASLANALQSKTQEETGLPHTYECVVFVLVDESTAIFHIKFIDADGEMVNDLAGVVVLTR